MSEMTPSKLSIKGIREGLLINLGGGEWEDRKKELLEHVEDQVNFFKGARIALDVGERDINAAEMGSLRDKLSDQDVVLWAVISRSSTTERSAKMLGLSTELEKVKPKEVETASFEMPSFGESALLVHRTVRSGVQVTYKGHVTVIGDVNPGGEIIAGGNVVVWGKLRGVVHAGADGDDNAVVCALNLMPTQLRINDKIAITPKRKGKAQPEVARIRDGQVIAEPWEYK